MDAFQSIRDYFFPDSIGITSEVTQNEEVSQLETESLIAHNRYRSLHNVPPLRLSDALTTKAKDRAMVINVI